jgi:hypothetical protein
VSDAPSAKLSMRTWAGGQPACAKGVEQGRPYARFRPSDDAIVERLPRFVFLRRVDPSAARFQNMNDAAEGTQILDTRLAARVGRQMRRNP